MKDNDKITAGNSLKDAIGKVELDPGVFSSGHDRAAMMGGKDFVHKSFCPMSHATVKFFEENDVPEIKGVYLKDTKGIANLVITEEADDITYALRADPVSPTRTLLGMDADYDGNAACPRGKRKVNVSHQRHGYSRRKAKRYNQIRYAARLPWCKFRIALGDILAIERQSYHISTPLLEARRPPHPLDFLLDPDRHGGPYAKPAIDREDVNGKD